MANNVFAEFGPQLANPFAEYGPKLEQAPAPTPKPEKTGMLRAAADIPVQVGRGVAVGVKALSDVFGADNPLSRAASGVEDFLGGLLSAQAKNDQAEIARLMKEAENKGVGSQVAAAAKAIATAPVDTISQVFGTAIPVIAGGLVGSLTRLGASAVGYGIGATMGAGTVKGSIYEAVKQELKANNVPEAEAERRAQEAQAYGGENIEQILLGAGLGAAASRGAERIITDLIKKGAMKPSALPAAGRIPLAAAAEALPEAAQAAQERIAQNIALQREGYEVPTMRGVVGQAALEGLAGAGLGGIAGAVQRTEAAKPAAPPTPEEPGIVKAESPKPETGEVGVTTPEEETAVSREVEKQARPTIPELRTRIDREAELQRQREQAGFEIERTMAEEQITTARERGMPEREERPDYVDLRPLRTPLEQRQAMTIAREEARQQGIDPERLELVPHPKIPEAMTIVRRAVTPEIKAPEPTIRPEEAQRRIEEAAAEGQKVQRRREDEARQVVLNRALQNIEERGGIASPEEARVVEEANIGKPYDRVDDSLGRTLSTDERLTEATGILVGRVAEMTPEAPIPPKKTLEEVPTPERRVPSGLTEEEITRRLQQARGEVAPEAPVTTPTPPVAEAPPEVTPPEVTPPREKQPPVTSYEQFLERLPEAPDIPAVRQANDAGDFRQLVGALKQSQNPVIQRIGELGEKIANKTTLRKPGVIKEMRRAAGVYRHADDSIQMNPKYAGSEQVNAHETLHALVAKAQRAPTEKQKATVKKIELLYQHVKRELAKQNIKPRDLYGLKNQYEFVAEAMSDPKFQYTLMQIPYKGNQSAWSAFVQMVADLLGIENTNALTEVMALTEKLAQMQPRRRKAMDQVETSVLEGKNVKLYHGTNVAFDKIDPSRSGGMAFFGEMPEIAARYAQSGGGQRAATDITQRYIVTDRGVVYELQGSKPVKKSYRTSSGETMTYEEIEGGSWVAVGLQNPDAPLINSKTILPLDKKYSDMTPEEAVEETNPNYGTAVVVPKTSRIIEKEFSDLNLLDITTPEGRDVIAGLQPTTRIGNILVRSAKQDANDKRYGETAHNLNSNFWSNTKYGNAYADQFKKDIIGPLQEMGYDGIRFSDDQHKTIALFESGLQKETRPLAVKAKEEVDFAEPKPEKEPTYRGEVGKETPPTPTTAGQQALDTINQLGMGVKAPEPGMLKKAGDALKRLGENPSGSKEEIKETIRKLFANLESKSFSSDARWESDIKKGMREDIKPVEDILGVSLLMSQSQAVGADAVSTRAMLIGGSKYDESIKKWLAYENKNANETLKARVLDQIAEKYGLTKEEASSVAHAYLVAANYEGIMARNAALKERIKQLKKDGKKDEADDLDAAIVFVSPEQAAMVEPGKAIANSIPEVKQITEIWNEQRRMVKDSMVFSGLWTEEYADALMDNAAYVPFYREPQVEADEGPKAMIRGLQVKAKEHKLKGSKEAVNDVFENMAMWQQYALNRAIRNHKALQSIDIGTTIKVGDRMMAEKVSEPKRGMNIVRVWRDGKQEFYSMADPYYVEAFQSLGSVYIEPIKYFSAISDMLRRSVVMYPLFSLGQIPQDAVAAIFASGLKPRYAFKIPFLAVREFVKTMRNTSKVHDELKNIGVVGIRDFNATIARQNAEITAGIKAPPGVMGKVKSVLEHVAMAADNAVRQSVYQASMDAGLSKAEAVEKAFEIINFRRRGSSKMLNLMGQTVPFFYAYLSAQRVAYRTITGTGISPQERLAALETLAMTSAAVMALSFIYAMANGGDEDYEDTPTTIRDRSIVIPGSGGVRIPLRPDFFLFPKVIAEHTYHLIAQNGFTDPAKFKKSMADLLANATLSPNVVPQVIKPTFEAAINYSFFEGKPVVGFFEKNKEASRQFNESTSEFGKFLGRFGASPQMVDHLARGYFGSVGGLFLWGTNFFIPGMPGVPRQDITWQDAVKTLPGVGAFKQKSTENALKVDFYELRDEVEKAKNTFDDIKRRSPEGLQDFINDEKRFAKLALEKRVTRVADELSKIRRAIQQVAAAPEDRFSAQEKGERIEELREIEKNLLKAVDVRGMREKAMM